MNWSKSVLSFGRTLAFGAALLAPSAGSAQSEKPEVIRIAYQPLVAIPQGAMKQMGWLEEATGTKVEWLNFSSGGDVNTAFAAGAVDFGLVGLPVFVSGIAQDIPYRLITLFDIPGTVDGMAVRNAAGIKTPADLKGKRIGVPFGSGADYMLQAALKENGLTTEDVTLVNLQPQPIMAAWTTEQIDAAFIWAPILTQLLEQDGTLLIHDGDMAKKGYFAGDVALVSNAFAEAHPDMVQAFVEQNLRAVKWVNENGPGAYDAMMKEYQLTPEQLKNGALPPATVFPDKAEQLSDTWLGGGAKGMVKSSMQIGEFLEGNKLISTAPTQEQLAKSIDASFLENAKDAQ